MPELPEVETVRSGLEPILVNRIVNKVRLNRLDLRFEIPKELPNLIEGHAIISVKRRAKFLLFEIGEIGHLISHLGMTGRYRVKGLNPVGEAAHTHPSVILPQHDHIELSFDNGATLIYNDVRRFGFVEWHPGELNSYARLSSYGPEPGTDSFSTEYLWTACKRSNAPIKALLLNQKVIAGLGNIYVCEALFRSRISPEKRAKHLTKKQANALKDAINQVIEAAIWAGGSTLRDFAHADGSAGYFQASFDVYDRESLPCNICGTTVKRVVQSNRSSFFCPKCQK